MRIARCVPYTPYEPQTMYLQMYGNRKWGTREEFKHLEPSYTQYGRRDSSSSPTTSTQEDTSSTTARCHNAHSLNRSYLVVYIYVCQSQITQRHLPRANRAFLHTIPMVAESRPHNLLLRLTRAPLRLQRRYHAYPLLNYASFVVYICVPIAN